MERVYNYQVNFSNEKIKISYFIQLDASWLPSRQYLQQQEVLCRAKKFFLNDNNLGIYGDIEYDDFFVDQILELED